MIFVLIGCPEGPIFEREGGWFLRCRLSPKVRAAINVAPIRKARFPRIAGQSRYF